jgi:hypothetical protein
VIGACSWPSMRAREVVEVGGVNLQSMVVGGVVAPLEGRPNGPRLCSLAATKASAARSAPAAAPVVIVVPLVSATRRPTVLHAHHDRDGRPATRARRQARFHAAASHHLGSDRRPRRGPLHPLRPALGGVNHLRRAQDPPARPEGRAPLEDPRRRPPRGLRLPVPALRRARPDAHRRGRRRAGPRPGLLHPLPARRSARRPHPERDRAAAAGRRPDHRHHRPRSG